MDAKALADQTIIAMKDFVSRSLVPVLDRLAALEARALQKGDKGDIGEQGERGEPGKDGAQGAPGRDGRDGMAGPAGKDGLNGKDGIDGKDGLHGKDGKDGLSVSDFDARLEDDGRYWIMMLGAGEKKEERRLKTGATIYRGVFREGQAYDRGDWVTWGGSGWHCNIDTKEKPGDGSKNWTLCIKKGRDGRDGDRGPEGPQGKQGPPGLDRR